MAWIIELDPAVERYLKKLDSQQAKRILSFLFGRVAHLDDPRSIGEALKGSQLNTFGNTVLEIIVLSAVLRIK